MREDGHQPDETAPEGDAPDARRKNGKGQRDVRSWFGPKRVGFGLRPQTWQGWVVVILVVAAVIVVRLVAGGHLFR